MADFFSSMGDPIVQENIVEVERVKELAVNSDVTSVHFSVHDKKRVDIVLETFEKGEDLAVRLINERLEINVGIPRKWGIFQMKKRFGKLTIYLPEQFAERYEVKCSIGNVRMADMIFKQLEMKAGAGEVEICAISAEYLMLESGAGNIEFHVDGEDDLLMKSGAGNIHVHFPNPEQLNATIEATAGLGSVRTDLPVGFEKSGEFSSVLGNGERDLKFTAGIGSIKLSKV